MSYAFSLQAMTGAVGSQSGFRPLVRKGHSVKPADANAVAKTGLLREFGAEPMVADALDEKAIQRRRGFRCPPDVIVHQPTDLKGALDLRKSIAPSRAAIIAHGRNRLSASGGIGDCGKERDCRAKLLRLALRARRRICEAPRTIRLTRTCRTIPRVTLDAIRHVEHAVTTTPESRASLIAGGLYGSPAPASSDPSMIEQVRKRHMPLIGGGTAWWSFLYVDDAAEATALAIERGEGIYIIVDDDPALRVRSVPALAAMLGAKPLSGKSRRGLAARRRKSISSSAHDAVAARGIERRGPGANSG